MNTIPTKGCLSLSFRGEGSRFYFCRLGMDPPRSATLQTLQALTKASLVYHEDLGAESSEFLRSLGLCLAKAPARRDQGEAFRKELISKVSEGRVVALVSHGAAWFPQAWSDALVKGLKELGAAYHVVPSVSPLDWAFSRCGNLWDRDFLGFQSCIYGELLRKDCTLQTDLPLVVTFPSPGLARGEAKALARSLRDRFGGECLGLLFLDAVSTRGELVSLGDLAVRGEGLGWKSLLVVSSRHDLAVEEAVPGPAGAKARNGRALKRVRRRPAPAASGQDDEFSDLIRRVLNVKQFDRGRARVNMLGLGLMVPQQITLEGVYALGRSDVIYQNVGYDGGSLGFLSSFGAEVRPLAPNHFDGVEAIVSEAHRGATVSMVSRGHPMAQGALPLFLKDRCRGLGVEAKILEGLSSLEALPLFNVSPKMWCSPGYQMREAEIMLPKPGRINGRWPLLLYFSSRGAGDFSFKNMQKSLLQIYPPDHECFLHETIQDFLPLRLRDLGNRPGTVTGREILVLPPLEKGGD